MAQAYKNVESSFERAEKGSKMFGTALLAVGTAITGAATVGINYAGEMENLSIAMQTVTGSVEEADEAMRIIKKTALDSPFFETDTLARFVQLMIASGEETMNAVNAGIRFGDVAAAFGKGNTELSRMGNTLSQVIGKGKADIVDFKELVNAGWVSVRKDVAESMGVSMEEFEKMISAGEIGYAQISQAAEKYYGAAEAQSKTLSSLLNRLKESFQTLLSDIIIDTGVFDKVKESLDGLITFIDENQEKIKQFIQGSFQWAIDNFPLLAGIVLGGLTPAFIALAGSIIAATIPLLPFIAIGAVIGLLVMQMKKSFENFQKAIEILAPYVDMIKQKVEDFVNSAIQFLGNLAQSVIDFLQPIIDAMTGFFSFYIDLWTAIFNMVFDILSAIYNVIILPILTAIAEYVQTKFNQIRDTINIVMNVVKGIMSVAWGFIKELVVDRVAEMVNNALQKFYDFRDRVKETVDSIVQFFKNMASDIMGALKSIKFPHLSIGEGSMNVAGQEIRYPKLNVDWYEKGGWVDRTGLAVVHQGEFVMSRDMLRGMAPVPATVSNNYQTNSPVNVYAQINNDMDAVTLGQILGFEIYTRGRYL